MNQLFKIVFSFTLFLSFGAEAAIVPIARDSFIHGQGIGVSNQTIQTLSTLADFNETLVSIANGTNGYVENYSVSQHSTIGTNGFTYSTAYSGSVESGLFAGVSVQTYFAFWFYVDEPSLLTLSVNSPTSGFGGNVHNLIKIGRNGNQIGGNLEYLWYFDAQSPSTETFVLDSSPNVGYFFFMNQENYIDPFNQRPRSFAFSEQINASVQATVVPLPASIWLFISSLIGLSAIRRSS